MTYRTPIALVFALVTVFSSSCATEGASWRAPASMAARVGGGVLAAAGPAVMVAGIMMDPEPATPPVESFAVGALLSAAGVAAVIAGGVIAEEEPAPAG